MTEQLPAVATQNSALIDAIKAGPYGSLSELAAAADVETKNLPRTIARLAEAGLAAMTGDAAWEVELTEAGSRAQTALAVFAGTIGFGAPDAASPFAQIDPADIDANPFQPRIVVDELADAELARSIADKGMLQPIIVRPHPDGSGRFQQALGHRRVGAARIAGIPVPADIRPLSDDDMAEIVVIENVQRLDLHWMDEAEAFRMLADRGKSAAQIRQLCGEAGRKKRSIQERIQFARELDDDAKARARLPEGAAGRITVDQARAMVGHKRARPALDLTPKLAQTLLELLHAGEVDVAFALGVANEAAQIVLHARPTGGPLIELSNRGVLKFAFRDGSAVAVIPFTEALLKYLEETGYAADPAAAVRKARAGVMGELAAGALEAAHRFATPELNPLPSEASAKEGPDIQATGNFIVGPSSLAQTPATQPQPPKPLPVLAEDAALVIIELAHKIAREAAPGAALPSCAIDASYRLDPKSNELVFARMLMFRVTDKSATHAALTPTALDWLDARGVALAAGLAQIDDAALQYAQVAAGRAVAMGAYATPWLTVQKAEPVAEPPAAPPRRDPFMQSILDVNREAEAEDAVGAQGLAPTDAADALDDIPDAVDLLDRTAKTLRRLLAAAAEARKLIDLGSSRRLKPEDTRAALALLDAAEGDAARDLARVDEGFRAAGGAL